MINISSMNIMPIMLSMKIMVLISATFSIFYFILAMIELLHIIYNHFRANYDWQKKMSPNSSKNSIKKLNPLGHYNEKPSIRLTVWVIIYIILTILLIIIFPINGI